MELGSLLKKTVCFCRHSGFVEKIATVYQQFDCTEKDAPEAKINACAAREHILEIKRQHRLTRERARAIVPTVPFQQLPG